MPLQWRNQLWQSSEEGAGKRCLECELGDCSEWGFVSAVSGVLCLCVGDALCLCVGDGLCLCWGWFV